MQNLVALLLFGIQMATISAYGSSRAELIIESPGGPIAAPMVRVETPPGAVIFWARLPSIHQDVGCQLSNRNIARSGIDVSSLIKHLNLDQKPNFVCRSVSAPQVRPNRILFEGSSLAFRY